MAISISSKGKTLRDDLEHSGAQFETYIGTMHDNRKAALKNAIAACAAALDVDGNQLHNTSLTIAASLTNNSITVTIS